jgi:BolA protein
MRVASPRHKRDTAALAMPLPAGHISTRSYSGTMNEALMATLEQRIRERLMIGLEPVRLDIINESHLHAGHAGDNGTGQTHFRVLAISEQFRGLSRVERHRLVNDLLAAEFRDGVHALALAARTPEERT